MHRKPFIRECFSILFRIYERWPFCSSSGYIEAAEKHILVDTGGAREDIRKNLQFDAPWESVRPYGESLARVGVTSDDIYIVIQTHLQFDDVLNIRKHCKAKVYAKKVELAIQRTPYPLIAQMFAGLIRSV